MKGSLRLGTPSACSHSASVAAAAMFFSRCELTDRRRGQVGQSAEIFVLFPLAFASRLEVVVVVTLVIADC